MQTKVKSWHLVTGVFLFFVFGSVGLTQAQPLLRIPDNREGSPFGINAHKLVAQNGPATAALDKLGFPWIRIDVNWNEVEPSQGVFNWTEMDAMVNNARAHGLLIFATLAYTPAWATDGTVRNGVPRLAAYYRDFVSAVVQRYKDQVKHWGLWNEPEQGHFWAGDAKGNPQQYIDLVLQPGYEAVKAADPTALVLGPDSGENELLDKLLSAGAASFLDILTLHVYACCDSSDNVDKVLYRLDCKNAWPWEGCLRKTVEGHGLLGQKPIWITEVGWKTNTVDWENKQADFTTALMDEMLSRPWWHKTFLYELYDETACNPSVDNCWGIIRPDWSEKPAFDALRSLVGFHQPLAEAGPDLVVASGETFILSGSASTDPDGSLVRYRWDFDRRDGVFADAEGMTLQTSFPLEGQYEVTLVVTDNTGIESADTLKITVGAVPCGAPCNPTLDGGSMPPVGDAGQLNPAGDAGDAGLAPPGGDGASAADGKMDDGQKIPAIPPVNETGSNGCMVSIASDLEVESGALGFLLLLLVLVIRRSRDPRP